MKTTLALLVIALLAVGSAWAQPGHGMGGGCPKAPMAPQAPGAPGHGFGMGGGMHGAGAELGLLRWSEELELSEQQTEQLEGMRQEHQMSMIDARAEMQKAELRLGTLMREENAPSDDVEAAIDRVAQLRADLQKARYRHRQECLSVLSDSQRDKLDQLRDERRDERREMRQGRRGDGQDRPQLRGRRFGSSS